MIGKGSVNLKMHSKTDCNVKLTGVYVTEGIEFNHVSLHEAQGRQKIIMDKDGVHLLDNRLTFIRGSIRSRLHATRMNPTDTNPLQDLLLFLQYLVFQPPRLVSPDTFQYLGFHLFLPCRPLPSLT